MEIAHFIQNQVSGFILDEISERGLNESWQNFLNLNSEAKLTFAQNGFEVSQKFTFENYLHNLKMKLFNVS